MESRRFTDNLIAAIKEKKLAPKPRWNFLAKETAVWVGVAGAAAVGSMATATAIFMIADTDWDIFERLGLSWTGHVLLSLPYVWLAVIAVSIAAAFLNFRHTRRGYRFGLAAVIAVGAGATVLLGAVLFSVGLDSEVHEYFNEKIPLYNWLVVDKRDIWDQPERGLLAGEVREIFGEADFELRDLSGQDWTILEEPAGRPVRVGETVKLIGTMGEDNAFTAQIIRPWGR